MNKTVLITGASSGIGRATAIYFANKGWMVAATMRNPTTEKELQQIKNISLYQLDVTQEEAISQVYNKVITDFGHIDVVVNNAGYGEVGVFEKSTSAQVRDQFEVNVFGVMNMTRGILSHFRDRKGGTIINITSVGGKMTFPLYSVYNASKFAIEGFAESLQYELRPFNIKIKNVEPGPVKTDFYTRSQNVFENRGIKEYDEYEKRILRNMGKMGNSAPGPEVVAETIYKAALDDSSRLRFPAGKDAKLILAGRKILPGRWFNAAVRRVTQRGLKSTSLPQQ